MKQRRIAEPNFDFAIINSKGKDLVGENFFTSEMSILKCTQGEAIISINSRSHVFKCGTNFLLPDLMLFSIVACSDDFSFTACCFSLQFFNAIYPLVDSKVLDVLQYSAPDFGSVNDIEATDLTFRQLCLLDENKNHAYRHKVATNLVVNYLLEIYELTYKHIESDVSSPSNHVNYIIESFYILCNENHTKHRNIEFYAEKLNISTRYLYKIIKDIFQATPKQIVDYHVSGTAKKMLLSTGLTIQQIADNLNFPDQATFGQFFKRNVGMSPSQFRNKYK